MTYPINTNLLKLTEEKALIQAGGRSCSHNKFLQGCLFVCLFGNGKICSSPHLAFWIEDPKDKYDMNSM